MEKSDLSLLLILSGDVTAEESKFQNLLTQPRTEGGKEGKKEEGREIVDCG